MKLSKKINILIVSLLVVLVTYGCSERTALVTNSDGLTITDMVGREISLKEPAQRVITLTAADCEIIYALGAEETLVARGQYCDYPAAANDKPMVQSGSDTNIEQILSLNPQVLIMSTMAQTEEQIKTLESAGVKVVVSDAQDIEGVYSAIAMIGTLLAKKEEAKKIVQAMKDTFADISSQASQNINKSIYFEVSSPEFGPWTAGEGTFMDEIAQMLGFTNIFSDVTGWAEIAEEQIIKRNPDYIVTIAGHYDDGPSPSEKIMTRRGWEKITAVKNKAICGIQNDELSRPGPRLAEGAKIIYDSFCRN